MAVNCLSNAVWCFFPAAALMQVPKIVRNQNQESMKKLDSTCLLFFIIITSRWLVAQRLVAITCHVMFNLTSHIGHEFSQLTEREPDVLCILIWCPCLITNFTKPWSQNSVCNTYTYHVDEAVIIPNSTCLPQSAPGMHHALCISSLLLPALLFGYSFVQCICTGACVCNQ